ncbi:hypothetical protein NDU88_003228 [Pleurodeles waltl]|uniref:Uncharacterized protein n=1 Tax=Pleurodeles waltl TaxID=8319 RepID=A0AAV7W2X0_PLEWA|nr:hypothetical protein NDU88_003228 [Pleurodeles waltl]
MAETEDFQVKEPVTRTFVEQLSGAVREDNVPLKQDIAVKVKELKNLGEVGHRLDTLERLGDKGEALNKHRREVMELQDRNEDLHYHLEDLEYRSPLSNICIRGVPIQADSGKLEDYVVQLFQQVTPELIDKDIILDSIQRVGRPARTPGMLQDSLTCLHSYRQKQIIMTAVRDKPTITFKGAKVGIFQDLCPLTL